MKVRSINARKPTEPVAKVRIPGIEPKETVWFISPNLSDRWGEINSLHPNAQAIDQLESDPALLKRLRSQMRSEETFIARKDGVLGILFEAELLSAETEGDPSHPKYEDVVQQLLANMLKLSELYPGIQFAAPAWSEVFKGRPAGWAFVKDGLLDDEQLDKFADAWSEAAEQSAKHPKRTGRLSIFPGGRSELPLD